MDIEVRYFHNSGEIYRPNGDYFDSENLRAITHAVRKEYESFKERIIAEKGIIDIHLKHNQSSEISYQYYIRNISPQLATELNEFDKS